MMRYLFPPLLLALAIFGALAAKKWLFSHPPSSPSFTTLPLPHSAPLCKETLEEEDLQLYPWESSKKGEKLSPITKEYFRCKGSSLNPPLPIIQDGKIVENIFDCGGPDSHSLPIRHGKEFIYPILIELLNEIQSATGKSVIITSGHRCPSHNHYVDSSSKNQTSKHMIGAEVSFYVAELETHPEVVLNAIFSFYKTNPRYAAAGASYTTFERYEKDPSYKIKPYFNKEIFIKIFAPQEGRDGDNRHPYPYFSIEVRFDKETNMRVVYGWNDAQTFLRK